MKIAIRYICASLIGAFWLICGLSATNAATLLPPGKNCFFTPNGVPNASGTVTNYIPGTTSPKDTWQDAGQTILNTNPITLDAAGCAVIYGVGTYRQILKDNVGVTIWDQPTSNGQSLSTSWGGTSTGSANTQIVDLDTFDLSDGQVVNFIAGYSNTGPMTINVNSQGPVAVVRDSGAGPVALVGGEIFVGNAVSVLYSEATGQFHILTPTPIQAFDSALFFTGIISPTPLAADQDNWTPTGGFTSANTVRVTATSAIKVTGLTGGAPGRVLFVQNVGSFPITFTANSTSSVAANRFLLTTSVTLTPNDTIIFQYDSVNSGWRIGSQQIAIPVAAGFKNLFVVNGGTPNSQIVGTVDAITLENSQGVAVRRLNLNCTADSSVAGAGGMDTGSVTSNAWYSYWFIYNPSTNTDSCLLSISSSLSALTLPSGYTFAARVSWNRTNASSQFNRVRCFGRKCQYVVTVGSPTAALPVMITGTTGSTSIPTWTSVAVGTFVPPTAGVIRISAYTAGAANATMIAPSNGFAGKGAAANLPPLIATSVNANATTVLGGLTLESANVFVASDGGTSGVMCVGWEDNI